MQEKSLSFPCVLISTPLSAWHTIKINVRLLLRESERACWPLDKCISIYWLNASKATMLTLLHYPFSSPPPFLFLEGEVLLSGYILSTVIRATSLLLFGYTKCSHSVHVFCTMSVRCCLCVCFAFLITLVNCCERWKCIIPKLGQEGARKERGSLLSQSVS